MPVKQWQLKYGNKETPKAASTLTTTRTPAVVRSSSSQTAQARHDSRVLKALQYLCMNLTESEIKAICIRGALRPYGKTYDSRTVFSLLQMPQVAFAPIVDINNKIAVDKSKVESINAVPAAALVCKSDALAVAGVKDKVAETIVVSDDETDENVATSLSVANMTDDEYLRHHMQGPHTDYICGSWMEARDACLSKAEFVAELRKAMGGA